MTEISLQPVSAWGRLTAHPHAVIPIHRANDVARAFALRDGAVLGTGLRRSYGDVGLNAQGRLLDFSRFDRFIAADWDSGIVRAEAGLSLDALLRVAVPKGWFAPVTPGTKFVTLGGAVANDVHGKNHHLMGTFGRFVRRLTLMRSNGEVIEASPERNADLFAATIGGLGLTGMILDVELSLMRIASAYIETETLPIANIDDFFEINARSADWPYTVAWVDCFATGAAIGRGLYMRGCPYAEGGLTVHDAPRLTVPLDAPAMLLNVWSMRGFNAAYRRLTRRSRPARVHYDGFFYPLDSIGAWNRLYGSRGFYQFQAVVPMEKGREAIRAMLGAAAKAGEGSFLIVLKTFGDLASPGQLSFPRPGVTLALDFPNRGATTRALIDRLNAMAIEAGGAIYPAKDATMTPAQFRSAYPRWSAVEAQRDPAIMSDFWRRVSGVSH